MRVKERRDLPQLAPFKARRKTRILVVGDEPRTVAIARLNFELEGFEVLEARQGREAVQALRMKSPDLVLLDVHAPDEYGLRSLRMVRETTTTPVVLLTESAAEADIAYVLHLGADDCVVKPFSPRELTSRVKAILRRARWSYTAPHQSLVRVDDRLQVDFNRCEVIVAGERIRLRPTEQRLLHLLMQNAGWTVPHSKLLRFVWGHEEMAFAHYVRLYINYLRAKIEENPASPYYILSERGYGYRFIDFQGDVK